MSEEVWSINESHSYDLNEGQTGVMVNGTIIPVEPGMNFKETIKNVSLNAGFGKYRVFLNGMEIRPSEAPQEFSAGSMVEIRPFDTAGCVV